MISRERVLTALKREEADRVPYCELAVDRALALNILGKETPADVDREVRELKYPIDLG